MKKNTTGAVGLSRGVVKEVAVEVEATVATRKPRNLSEMFDAFLGRVDLQRIDGMRETQGLLLVDVGMVWV